MKSRINEIKGFGPCLKWDYLNGGGQCALFPGLVGRANFTASRPRQNLFSAIIDGCG